VVLTATATRDRLDERIAVVAASPQFCDQLDRPGCPRGVSALTGFSGLSIGAHWG
jgi:transposase